VPKREPAGAGSGPRRSRAPSTRAALSPSPRRMALWQTVGMAGWPARDATPGVARWASPRPPDARGADSTEDQHLLPPRSPPCSLHSGICVISLLPLPSPDQSPAGRPLTLGVKGAGLPRRGGGGHLRRERVRWINLASIRLTIIWACPTPAWLGNL
jgi:hypothetical protein